MLGPVRELMRSSRSVSFFLFATLLNPVLFLHGLNAVLARMLPPVEGADNRTPSPPYYPNGPSAEHPHLDIHASDGLCWSYTLLMVGIQLLALCRFVIQSEDGVQETAKPPRIRIGHLQKFILQNGSPTALPGLSAFEGAVPASTEFGYAEDLYQNIQKSRVHVNGKIRIESNCTSAADRAPLIR